MAESALKYRLSHLTVQLIAIINIATVAFDVFYPKYHQVQRQLDIDDALVWWYFASSLLLPLYVAVEAWWMLRKTPLEGKELLIDTVLAVAWFLVWWVGLLYAWLHYAPI